MRRGSTQGRLWICMLNILLVCAQGRVINWLRVLSCGTPRPVVYRCSSALVLMLMGVAFSGGAAGEPLPNHDLWRANTPWCAVDDNGKNSKLVLSCDAGSSSNAKPSAIAQVGLCFPSKGGEEPTQPCDDGDMTLFNGLLCSAGFTEGCDAVANSQDSTSGRWYRSPRRRLLGPAGTANSFSPDMAIGVYHWLVSNPTSENKRKFEQWLEWLAKNKRCLNDDCSRQWPRFCPDDDVDQLGAEYGCTMRPGDLATLGIVAGTLGIVVKDAQIKSLSEKWKDSAITLAWVSAHTNEVGYSLHLSASVLFLYKRLGLVDAALSDAIESLYGRQPMNPFFAYLAGEKASAISLAVGECPANQQAVPPLGQRFQWSWERADSDKAWKKTMLWDCLFMSAKLQ